MGSSAPCWQDGPASGYMGLGAPCPRRYYLDMRILVVGEESRKCDEMVTSIVQRLVWRYGRDVVIVHGDPTGAVESFEEACKKLGIRTEMRVPDWRTGTPPVDRKSVV